MYEDKFKEIKQAFQLRAALHTDITVMRVIDRVESTGMATHYFFRLWS
jgi:hypothetical protein